MSTPNEHVEPKLIDFAYGELPDGDANLVRRHLDQCAQCAKALSELQGVRRAMSRLAVEPAPAKGMDSLLIYARQSARRPRRSFLSPMRWAAPVGFVAALSLVIVIAVQVDRGGRVSLSPTPSDELRQQPLAKVSAEPQEQAPAKAPALVEKGVVVRSRPSDLKADQPSRDFAVPPKDWRRVSRPDLSAPAMQEEVRAKSKKEAPPAPSKEFEAERPLSGVAHQQERAGEVVARREAKPHSMDGVAAGAASGPSNALQNPSAPAAAASKSSYQVPNTQASMWAERAARAKQAGNRKDEATYLRRAIAMDVQGTQLLELLARLCDAERALKSASGVRESCGRIVTDYPGTREARLAETILNEFASQP